MGLKFIDLFAGVGGFHYGIDRVAEALRAKTEGNADNQELSSDYSSDSAQVGRQPDFTCVYSNEWDKYANSVYRRHYGQCDNRDIRTVDAQTIPDHDLLCGGFPCQSFSIAGKRGGFEDTRGTLFFEMARIAKEKHPRLLLFENVKGLLSHDNGRTFATIIQTIDELGYDCQWQVLNSKNHGVPQNRERVFIVGHLRGTPRPEVFPIGENGKEDNGGSEYQISGTVDTSINRNHRQSGATYIKDMPQAFRVRSVDGSSSTLQGEAGGTGAKTGLYKTITGIRRLTPIECERLQGFPDNWTQYGADGELISDTQRYKMCGNAVTTNVITEIAKRLI